MLWLQIENKAEKYEIQDQIGFKYTYCPQKSNEKRYWVLPHVDVMIRRCDDQGRICISAFAEKIFVHKISDRYLCRNCESITIDEFNPRPSLS